MTFNIHQDLFALDGETIDEPAARQYMDHLVALFEASPEARALDAYPDHLGWSLSQMRIGLDSFGITPPTTQAIDLVELVFNIFPRKMAVEPSEAKAIVEELVAFWTFLGRSFDLENAGSCVEVFDSDAAENLEQELADPDNWGPAKSLAMFGQRSDFDLTTEEGRAQAMLAYNASLTPPRPGGFGSKRPAAKPPKASKVNTQRKNRRKSAKASRKKNRKR